ncbi:MAG: hypothetical protein OER56_16245 [Hyphomicrobiales bacterium]|nr:hypothetical protein [Hyphomicrobiales bacterium]
MLNNRLFMGIAHEQLLSSWNGDKITVLKQVQDVTGVLPDHRAIALRHKRRTSCDIALLDRRDVDL